MKYLVFSDPLFAKHRVNLPHPESPTRIATAEKWIRARSMENLDVRLCSRVAKEEELQLVHSEKLIQELAATRQEPITWVDNDTYITSDSTWIAKTAAGTLLDTVDAAYAKAASRLFALVRPPGHHAESNRSMGFCLFNNVAIAAAYAVTQYSAKRVAIYDFDLHHGNGTQEIFYKRPDVLYLSQHQFPHYPGTGNWHETGENEGKGKTINAPLSEGAGDAEILHLWDQIFQPILDQYDPELLLVSAGFDSHENDPLGNLSVTDNGFAQLALRLEALTTAKKIPLIFAMEGGYNADAVSTGIRSIFKAHLKPSRSASAPTATPNTNELLGKARNTFQPFWTL